MLKILVILKQRNCYTQHIYQKYMDSGIPHTNYFVSTCRRALTYIRTMLMIIVLMRDDADNSRDGVVIVIQRTNNSMSVQCDIGITT